MRSVCLSGYEHVAPSADYLRRAGMADIQTYFVLKFLSFSAIQGQYLSHIDLVEARLYLMECLKAIDEKFLPRFCAF